MSKEIEIINQLEDLISDRLSFITDDKETSEIYQRDINAIKGIIELNKQLKENYEAVVKQRDDTSKSAVETIEKYQEEIDLYKSVIDEVRNIIDGFEEEVILKSVKDYILEILDKVKGSDK